MVSPAIISMRLMLTVLLPSVALLLLLQMSSSSVSAAPSSEDDDFQVQTGASSRHKRFTDTKVDLEALKDNLATMEDGLSNFQKRSCAVGLNSHHCAIAHLDDVLMGTDYLSGGFSPGKRNTELPEDIRTRAEMLLQNLSEQKQAVSALRTLVSKLGARVEQQARKRTCAIRLANHCLTEALDRAANQYYYLQSPLSPGRRRRGAEETGGRQQASGGKAQLLTLTSYSSQKSEGQSSQDQRR